VDLGSSKREPSLEKELFYGMVIQKINSMSTFEGIELFIHWGKMLYYNPNFGFHDQGWGTRKECQVKKMF
jgi:hypothetical protein